MKWHIFAFLLAAIAIVECKHTFVGTNVRRPVVYHRKVLYGPTGIGKRVKNIHFSLPASASKKGQFIQGIMAYDLTHSGATANVTDGGIGFSYTNLLMESERGKGIHFDVHIYA